MKRRIIAAIITLTTVVGSIPNIASADTLIYAEDNFNDINEPREFLRKWSGLPVTTSVVADKNNGKAMRIATTETIGAVNAIYNLSSAIDSGVVKVSYSIKPGNDASTFAKITDRDGKSYAISFFSSDKKLCMGRFSSSDTYAVYADSYNNDEWYDIESIIDIDNQKAKTIITDSRGNIYKSLNNDFTYCSASKDENPTDISSFSFSIWSSVAAMSDIDDFRIEKVDFDMNLLTHNTGHIFGKDENTVIYAKLKNTTDCEKNINLLWTVKDEAGNTVKSGENKVSILGNSELEFPVSLSNIKFGIYTFEANASVDGITCSDSVDFSKILSSDNGEQNPNFGFSTHITRVKSPKEETEIMKKIGIAGVRDDFMSWNSAEKEVGIYNISQTGEESLDALENSNFENINMLGYGNVLRVNQVDNNGNIAEPSQIRAPRTDDEISAFGDYCAYMAGQSGKAFSSYEIWNEWDGSFNIDGLDAVQYTKILKEGYTRVKQVQPDAEVVGISGMEKNSNIKTVLENGGYDYFDAYSLHPYDRASYFPNGDWLASLRDKKNIVRNYEISNGLSTRKPLYLTEIGWSTALDYQVKPTNHRVVDEKTQAELMVRLAAFNEAYDLADKIYIYGFQNVGDSTNNEEDQFGVINSYKSHKGSFTAKPALVAISAMNKLMNGGITASEWESIENTEKKEKYINTAYGSKQITAYTECAYVFDRGASDDGIGNNLAVLWSDDGKDFILDLGTDTVDMYDIYGNKTQLRGAEGVYCIDVEDEIVYLVGDFTKFEETTDISCTIDTVSYDADKNIVTVSGTANGARSVPVSMYKGDRLVQTEICTVKNGRFSKIISPKEDGEYTICPGYLLENAVSTKSISVVRNVICESSLEQGIVVACENNIVTVSGSVRDFKEGEEVAVMVVPKNCSEFTMENIKFLDQLSLDEFGQFSSVFDIPQGLYSMDIYVNIASSEKISGSYSTNLYKAATLDVSEANDKITALTKLINSTSEGKSACIIIAQYDKNNKLISTASKTEILPADMTFARNCTFTTDKDANTAYIRAFVWTSFEEMIPLI